MTWRERIAGYVHARLPSADVVEVDGVHGMPAGASNETVGFDLRVTVEGEQFHLPVVLRPERQAGILAPYDISRQFRVMRALKGSGVPVPAVYWYEPGTDVIGAPFYFMQRIPGETLPLLWYGGISPRLRAVAEALAAIHDVDWRERGLDFLAAARRRDAAGCRARRLGAAPPAPWPRTAARGQRAWRLPLPQPARRRSLRPAPRRPEPRQLSRPR
ncbi:MAG: phosphotransferase [Dehalococcoidia bacterium]|nr:phosphotransferase [Dehalococcoidia bacterium]